MKAYELAGILLKHPKTDVDIALSDTGSPNCVLIDFEEEDIEVQKTREKAYLYINIKHPLNL